MVAAVWVAAAGACSKVNPFYCDGTDEEQCRRGGELGTCVSAYGACAFDDLTCEEFGLRYDGSAGGLAGVCVGREEDAGVDPLCEVEYCGDMYTECLSEDPLCPPGDRPNEPVLLEGPSATADLSVANSEFSPLCGEEGGRDAFFQFSVAARQLVYLDTWGSDFRAVLAVRAGPCSDSAGEVLACSAFPCDEDEGLATFARTLDPGTYCAIVDQYDFNDAVIGGFDAHLRIFRGPPEAIVLSAGIAMGDTCTAADLTAPSCAGTGGKDVVYALLVCPGSRPYTLDTCPLQGTYAPILSLRSDDFAGGTELTCAPGCDAGTGLAGTFPGPGIFWLSVDGADGSACGPYELHLGL